MNLPVMTVDAALDAPASANTPGELIALSNQAAALQVYARRAKLGLLAQNRCAEIRLRAERKLGELLTTTPRLHGRPKSVPDGNTFPSLSELGVADRKISHRAQRIAAVPITDFEAYFRDAQHEGWEITTRHLLLLSQPRQASSRNRQRIVGRRVRDLIEFTRAGPEMGCSTTSRGHTTSWASRGWARLVQFPWARCSRRRSRMRWSCRRAASTSWRYRSTPATYGAWSMSELVDRVDRATTEIAAGVASATATKPPRLLAPYPSQWARYGRSMGRGECPVRASANQQPVCADGWLSGLARQTPMPPSETAGAGPTNPGLRPQPSPASRRCAPATR